MTIQTWQKQSEQQLKDAGVSTARLDCLVLLEDTLGHDRAWILSHSEDDLQGSELDKLNTKIVQRAQHIPLAYLRGHVEFYSRDFVVNEHTLVPRPETETMIELVKHIRNREADVLAWQIERRGRKPIKKQYKFEKPEPVSELVHTPDGYKVVWPKQPRPQHTQQPAPIHGNSLRHHDEDLMCIDIGTGSGAIAITAKLEIPDATVLAGDIDEQCLATTRTNAKRLGADITVTQSDLLAGFSLPTNKIIVLLCNLPYVPDDFHINTAATHEPHHALFGGPDGLDLYRRMFQQIGVMSASADSARPQHILAESLPSSHAELAAIAKAAGFHLTETDDFIQHFEATQ